MINIPEEQKKFFKDNFGLTTKDMPTDYMTPTEFVQLLLGENVYRGSDYVGDSSNSVEDIYMAATARDGNKYKFNRVLKQLFSIREMCLRLEYYELLHNIRNIVEDFDKAIKWEKMQVSI